MLDTSSQYTFTDTQSVKEIRAEMLVLLRFLPKGTELYNFSL